MVKVETVYRRIKECQCNDLGWDTVVIFNTETKKYTLDIFSCNTTLYSETYDTENICLRYKPWDTKDEICEDLYFMIDDIKDYRYSQRL